MLAGILDHNGLDIRHVQRRRDRVIQQVGIQHPALIVIPVALHQAETDRLDGATLHLAFHQQGIERPAHVLSGHQIDQPHLPGSPIDFHRSDVYRIRGIGGYAAQHTPTVYGATGLDRHARQLAEADGMFRRTDNLHPLIRDDQVVHCGLQFFRGHTQQLPSCLAGGLARGRSSRISRLATRAQRRVGHRVRIPEPNRHLLDRYAQFLGHDLRHHRMQSRDVHLAGHHGHGSVSGHCHERVGRTGRVVPIPHGDSHTLVGFQFAAAPSRGFGGLSDGVFQPVVLYQWLIAFAQPVFQTDLHRVDFQLTGQHIQVGFPGKRRLRATGGPVRARPRLVGAHGHTFQPDIRNLVGPQQPVRRPAAAQKTAVPHDSPFNGRQGPVFSRTRLQPYPASRPRAAVAKILPAVDRHLHRSARAHRQQGRMRFNIQAILPAETATGFGHNHAHAPLGQVQRLREAFPFGETALPRRPDSQPSIRLHARRGRIRFHVGLIEKGNLIFRLDNRVRVRKASLDVPLLQHIVGRHVPQSASVRIPHVLCGRPQDGLRSIRIHGVHRIHNRGQYFIVHVDQRKGVLCDIRIHSRHGRHLLPLVADLFGFENRQVRYVPAAHHVHHPGQLFGSGGVDLPNARVTVRAAQDAAV